MAALFLVKLFCHNLYHETLISQQCCWSIKYPETYSFSLYSFGRLLEMLDMSVWWFGYLFNLRSGTIRRYCLVTTGVALLEEGGHCEDGLIILKLPTVWYSLLLLPVNEDVARTLRSITSLSSSSHIHLPIPLHCWSSISSLVSYMYLGTNANHRSYS